MPLFGKLSRAAIALATFAGCEFMAFAGFQSDVSLTAVSRVFQPSTIKGMNLQKAAEALSPSQCPGSNILHRAIMKCTMTKKPMYIIPHAAIQHDGELCGTGGPDRKSEYMIVIPGEQISDPRTAVINGLAPLYGLLSSNARAINAFNVLRGLDPIHVGFEYSSERKCGGKVAYPQNTIFFFLAPSEGGQDLNFGFAYLGVTEIGMVSVKEDEQLCLYKQSRNLGPGQAPFATPSPSVTPGRNANLPGNLFNLDDPADIDPCFPVQELSATSPVQNQNPTPTVSNQVEKSNSPSPSPTRTPTMTPTPSKAAVPQSDPSPMATKTESPTESPSPTETTVAAESSTSSPSPSRSATGNSTSDPACFPGEAIVELSSGSLIPISHLRIGDKVLTGHGKFSDVFMFSHHTNDVFSKFILLSMTTNKSLTISPGHYLPVDGQFKTAESVQTGDIVQLGSGKTAVITSRKEVVRRGLHNPQTLDGQIVVDGVVASTFTQAVHPCVALSLLVPVKFFYFLKIVKYAFEETFSHGCSFMANLLPSGSAVL